MNVWTAAYFNPTTTARGDGFSALWMNSEPISLKPNQDKGETAAQCVAALKRSGRGTSGQIVMWSKEWATQKRLLMAAALISHKAVENHPIDGDSGKRSAPAERHKADYKGQQSDVVPAQKDTEMKNMLNGQSYRRWLLYKEQDYSHNCGKKGHIGRLCKSRKNYERGEKIA